MSENRAKGIILWNDIYMDYNFGKNHPFAIEKIDIYITKIRELIHEKELNAIIFENLHPIEIDELENYMDPKFLKVLKEKETTQGAMIDPGTPAFPNMVNVSSTIATGTYLAISKILNGDYKYGFNVLGGFHHAKPYASAGGCVLNDMGIGIRKLRLEDNLSKIAIIDIDFHPHDGTAEYFIEDPLTLCASIHDKGWFDFDESLSKFYKHILNHPYTKKNPISISEYIEVLKTKIFPKIKEFEPKLIILVHGVDGHSNDPVTYYGQDTKSISLTTEDYAEINEVICQLANDTCEGKILGLGAGGYSKKDTSDVWIQATQIFDKLIV